MKIPTVRSWLILLGGLLLFPAALQAQSIRIRIGTVAPQDSPWHETLKQLRQEWHRISQGAVKVQIYPGGVLGDGPEMVRQVRAGRIQAVTLTSAGLHQIDKAVSCLQIPLMLDSFEELDYVRARISDQLERRLEERGFKLLHWGEVGWVHSFTTQPARTPDELRKLKLFTHAGDPEMESLYKEFGFRVVPLSLTDVITSLQTGMIEAVSLPPIFALLNESYRLAPNMASLRWTPLVGGTVISLKTWEQIPQELRPGMLEAATQAGDLLRDKIRRMDHDAVAEMKKRGLQVTQLNQAELEVWQKEAEAAYPRLRGRYCPADLFDQVRRLRDEFRSHH